VLILVPGGSRPIGGQRESIDQPNFVKSWNADGSVPRADEIVLREPRLDAHFLSKYEMTQAQWRRMCGVNPSEFYTGKRPSSLPMISGTTPVEMVSWNQCSTGLLKWNLELPTEAQWEVAARADVEAWFWWGSEWPPPANACNLYDGSVGQAEGSKKTEPYSDGEALLAEVDSFDPNPWGFHHILGNVGEFCRDWFVQHPDDCSVDEGTGEQHHEEAERKVHRGGAFDGYPNMQRVTRRSALAIDAREYSIGLRPSRALDLGR
jgi:formylglycine-generating enzyme required for sulfatase activity